MIRYITLTILLSEFKLIFFYYISFIKLRRLRELLSSHVPETMSHILRGIKYEKDVSKGASLTELVDILIEELMSRILSGKEIVDELTVIHDVDSKWWDGEYDDEVEEGDDDLAKGVRVSERRRIAFDL